VIAAVTGWALRTPLGASVDVVTTRLLAGERAAGKGQRFDMSAYPCSVGAGVPGEPPASRHDRFVDRMGRWAMDAGAEALAMAGASGGDGLALFAAVGGIRAGWDEIAPALVGQADDGARAFERGLRLLHPFWMLRYLSNNAHAILAAALRATGEGLTFAGAGAGAAVLAAAGRALSAGAADACLVIAYDSLLSPETLLDLGARGETAGAALDGLEAPYGPAAAGFFPGEAAAALVLERPEGAGARALAYVDAACVADGEPGQPRSETLARAAARVARGERVVDGAARARPALDEAERRALAGIAGDEAALVATAASQGHLGAATALVQVISLAGCLRRGLLPPIAGLTRPSAGGLRPVLAAEPTLERAALAVSAGAPGLAAAVRIALR